MIVKFYAKKLDGKGHTYLNTLEIPEGRMEWRIPVRQPLEVKFVDGGEMAPPNVNDAVRVFRWKPTQTERLLDELPMFFEE